MIRTLLLSAAALAALATAAIAAPAPPTGDGATGAMVSMHATGVPPEHTASSGMGGMHAAMMATPAVHESMLDDPTMQAHITEFGIDAEQMRRWHDEGRTLDEIHEMLAEQGIDVEAMEADCPTPSGDSMASMHGDGGRHLGGHHGTPGR